MENSQVPNAAGKKGKITTFTWILFLFSLFNLVFSLALSRSELLKFRQFPPFHPTVQRISDSSVPIAMALEWKHENRHSPIYRNLWMTKNIDGEEIIIGVKRKFIYPTTSLLFFYPFHWQSREAFSWFFDNYANSFFFLIGIAAILIFFFRSSHRDAADRGNSILQFIGIVFLLCADAPYIAGFHLGQIQVWINTLIILGLLFYMQGKHRLSGICLALSALIKPQYALFLLWGLIAGKKRFTASMALVLIAGIILSILTFGVQDHFDYLKLLRHISERGEYNFGNQSVNGLVNRMVVKNNRPAFDHNHFAPYNPLVARLTLISSLLLIGGALFLLIRKRLKKNQAGTDNQYTIEWLVMIIGLTIASPTAWPHHYGFNIVVYLFMFAWFLRPSYTGRRWLPLLSLGISYMLSTHLFPIHLPPYNAFPLNIIQSHQFFGQIILLSMLAWLSLLNHPSSYAMRKSKP